VTPLRLAGDLYLIPLDQAACGFVNFIGAWLHLGEKTCLIDTGPSSTAPLLIDCLRRIVPAGPDLICLTHIHIDHAGGVGHLAAAFPDAPVVCHPKAVRHLAQPEKLWAGSLKSLGELARVYGPIPAVPEQRLLPSDRQGLGIDTVTTPGHAVHHVCYRSGDYLFAGEAGGVFQEFRGGRDYLRPATPVRFFLETSIASIDRLLDLAPGRICYGHFGMHDQAELQLKAHRSQLLQWADICGERIDRVSPNTFLNDCLELLLAKDPHLASYHRFSEDVQSRERGFLENSLRGFEDYLRKR